MKLLFDGKSLLFSRREIPVRTSLTLSFPFEGVLQINGSHRMATENGMVQVPLAHLAEGKNVLLFRKERCVLPVEGLLREGDLLRPSGFPLHETVASLLDRLSSLETEIAELKQKEAARTASPSLFS